MYTRLLYETYFELVLCALLTFGPQEPYSDDNIGFISYEESKEVSVEDKTFLALVLLICELFTLYVAGFSW